MVYNFFGKKPKGSGVTTLSNKSIKPTPQNEQLADELHKPIIQHSKTIFGLQI